MDDNLRRVLMELLVELIREAVKLITALIADLLGVRTIPLPDVLG